MVKHRGRDGEEHLYSSKPPLLATLMAGEYWLIYQTTGATLAEYPYEIGRFMLVMINVVPMLVYFCLLARLAERFGTTDWGRIFMMAAATFGTFLTTFVVTINNHTPAAVCVAIALYAAVRIWYDGGRRVTLFRRGRVVRGAGGRRRAAGAVAVRAAWARRCCGKRRARRSLAYLPAALLVAVAAVGTNYIAHDSLRPPYMHRSQTDPADNWYDYSYVRDGKVRDSYWRDPVGIDRGEPSVAVYALHATVGHHGIFSLTPVWLLSVWGLALMWRGRTRASWPLLIAVLSVVCLAFYICAPADGPQLRRHDQRFSLDVLVRAAVAGGAVAGGRPAERVARRTRLSRWCCWRCRSCRSATRPGIPGRIPGCGTSCRTWAGIPRAVSNSCATVARQAVRGPRHGQLKRSGNAGGRSSC